MFLRLSSAALCLMACSQSGPSSDQRVMSSEERKLFSGVTDSFLNVADIDLFRAADLPFKSLIKDCDIDSQVPQKKGLGGESGYFYLIVGSSGCPIHYENRVSVIHSQPEGRISLRTALLIMDKEKVGSLSAYEAEGVLALFDTNRGYRVSGTFRGVIYQEPKIKFEILIEGDLTSGFVTLERETHLSFPSFVYTSKSLGLLNFNLSKLN